MDELIFYKVFKNKSKISGINDGNAILSVAKSHLEKGDNAKAITYLKRYLDNATDKKEIVNTYFYLSQAYSSMRLYEQSNYYLFCMFEFKNDELNQLANFGLGVNFMAMRDFTMAKYYFNNCLSISENSDIAKKVKTEIKIIDTKFQPKFKVYSNEQENTKPKTYNMAEHLLASGKFEEAISKFNQMPEQDSERAKTSIALCYFLMGDSQKAIDVTLSDNKYLTLLDLCNLAIFYDSLMQREKVEDIVKQMLIKPTTNLEEVFKMGVTFSQIGKHELAMKYFGKYISYIKYDSQSLLLYSIACLNCNELSLAKETLILANTLDIFNNQVYKYYLGLCTQDKPKNLSYIFEIQPSATIANAKKVKQLLSLDDAKFKKAISGDVDFVMWVLKEKMCPQRNNFLLRVAQVKDKNIDELFKKIMIDASVSKTFKYNLLSKRLHLLQGKKYAVVTDNIYNTFSCNDMRFAKDILTPDFIEGYIIAQMYILEKNYGGDVTVNIRYKTINVFNCLAEKPNKYILAAILAWSFLSGKNLITIKKLCKELLIDEIDFFKFYDLINIEEK